MATEAVARLLVAKGVKSNAQEYKLENNHVKLHNPLITMAHQTGIQGEFTSVITRFTNTHLMSCV